MNSEGYKSRGSLINQKTIPFENVEEAWFWFVSAQQAKNEGARITAGQSLYPRPCEPIDILKTVERLYRQRRLTMDHLRVLKHYGQRSYAPDVRRSRESRAYQLWKEAMDRVEPVLERKGIIRKAISVPGPNWFQDCVIYENLRGCA